MLILNLCIVFLFFLINAAASIVSELLRMGANSHLQNKRREVPLQCAQNRKVMYIYIYVTGFAKTSLIAGIRNCSYSPFSSAKLFFVDFLFSSKIKNMALMLYVHTIIIPGELYKG